MEAGWEGLCKVEAQGGRDCVLNWRAFYRRHAGASTHVTKHTYLHPFSSHLAAHSLRAEVTVLLGQVDGGVDHLLMALLLALRDRAAGAAEQARDPVAGGVLHRLAALLGEVPIVVYLPQ